jgi:hypothetical protein
MNALRCQLHVHLTWAGLLQQPRATFFLQHMHMGTPKGQQPHRHALPKATKQLTSSCLCFDNKVAIYNIAFGRHPDHSYA